MLGLIAAQVIQLNFDQGLVKENVEFHFTLHWKNKVWLFLCRDRDESSSFRNADSGAFRLTFSTYFLGIAALSSIWILSAPTAGVTRKSPRMENQ